jgi:hypothetical protein
MRLHCDCGREVCAGENNEFRCGCGALLARIAPRAWPALPDRARARVGADALEDVFPAARGEMILCVGRLSADTVERLAHRYEVVALGCCAPLSPIAVALPAPRATSSSPVFAGMTHGFSVLPADSPLLRFSPSQFAGAIMVLEKARLAVPDLRRIAPLLLTGGSVLCVMPGLRQSIPFGFFPWLSRFNRRTAAAGLYIERMFSVARHDVAGPVELVELSAPAIRYHLMRRGSTGAAGRLKAALCPRFPLPVLASLWPNSLVFVFRQRHASGS